MTTAAKPEFPSCLDCVFYRPLCEEDGSVVGHLCHLPPECAPPLPEGDDDDWRDDDRDIEGREYLGTFCDVMRRMGALCGPRAAMWEARR